MLKVNTTKKTHAVKWDAKFGICVPTDASFSDIEFESAGLHSIFV